MIYVSLTCVWSCLNWICCVGSCLKGLSWIEFGLDWFGLSKILLEFDLGLGRFYVSLPWCDLILVSGLFDIGVSPTHKSRAHGQVQEDWWCACHSLCLGFSTDCPALAFRGVFRVLPLGFSLLQARVFHYVISMLLPGVRGCFYFNYFLHRSLNPGALQTKLAEAGASCNALDDVVGAVKGLLRAQWDESTQSWQCSGGGGSCDIWSLAIHSLFDSLFDCKPW